MEAIYVLKHGMPSCVDDLALNLIGTELYTIAASGYFYEDLIVNCKEYLCTKISRADSSI